MTKYQQPFLFFLLDIKFLSFRNELTTSTQILLNPITVWPKSYSAQFLFDPNPARPNSRSTQILLAPNPARPNYCLAKIQLNQISTRIPCSSPRSMTKTRRFMINIYRIRIETNMLRSVIPEQYKFLFIFNNY